MVAMTSERIDRTRSRPGAIPAVTVAHVTKRFGAATAVDDVSLEIEPNEFFSILGPSGCGKTTLMRMITGFEMPTAGHIELSGVDVTHRPPNKRDLNMLFQSYALFPHLSVFDNVAFELKVRRRPRGEMKSKVGEALDLVRLAGYERRKPSELSGGQRQRVALARAVVSRPGVVLLDEPLGALDLKLRQEMQLELKRMQREVGITFVYVTHDQEEALTMSDRIAVMSEGRVLQIDTPRAIYHHPATRFVADFIGRSTFLSGRVDATGRFLDVDGLGPVPLPRHGIEAGDAACVAIRPERVRIEPRRLDDPTPPGDFALPATVGEVIFAGSDTQAHLRLDNGQHLLCRVADDHAPPATDEQVWVRWPVDATAALPE